MHSMNSQVNDKYILENITAVMDRIRKNDYCGYDPADLLNSRLGSLKKMPSPVIRFMTLLNFYSPVNLRGVLRIEPFENTSAMVVFGAAYVRLFRLTKDTFFMDEAVKMVDWLLEKSLKKENGVGWCRTISYQASSSHAHDEDSSLTFINSNAGELLLDIYEVSGNEIYLQKALETGRHLCFDTNKIINDCGVCLSYSEKLRLEILNASILAGSFLERLSRHGGGDEILQLAWKILDYTLAAQNEDGSWFYSYRNGKGKKQFDFHQSYMLDGIKGYENLRDKAQEAAVSKAFESGMDFYRKMFSPQGMPYWRYPHFYPVDIHNISHAIFFFSKYNLLLDDAEDRLEQLLDLCMNRFFDEEKKYFYYQMYPGKLRIKHNFLRWNNAWTVLALSEYLLSREKTNNQE